MSHLRCCSPLSGAIYSPEVLFKGELFSCFIFFIILPLLPLLVRWGPAMTPPPCLSGGPLVSLWDLLSPCGTSCLPVGLLVSLGDFLSPCGTSWLAHFNLLSITFCPFVNLSPTVWTMTFMKSEILPALLFFRGLYLGMYKSVLFLQDMLMLDMLTFDSLWPSSRSLPLSLWSRYKRVWERDPWLQGGRDVLELLRKFPLLP